MVLGVPILKHFRVLKINQKKSSALALSAELQITFFSRELLTPHFVVREFFLTSGSFFTPTFFFKEFFFTISILMVRL